MKRFVITMVGVASLLVVALVTSRDSRAQRKPEMMRVTCGAAEFNVCTFRNGGMGPQKGQYPTREEQEAGDRSWRACGHLIDQSTLRGWEADATIAVPNNLAEAEAHLARCLKCKAAKPGGGWCREGAYGGATYGGSTYGGRPAADKTAELARCFEQTARDKIADGYFVKNDGFWRGAKHMIQDLTFWANTEKGGRCGDYGYRGMLWMKSCVDNLFGDKAVLDDITVEEQSAVKGRAQTADWTEYLSPDQMFEANHRATRVVLPDGRRFVLDFWDGISSGNPRMVPESEWVAKWKRSVGEQLIGIDKGVVQLSEDQLRIKALIKRYGSEEKAFEVYRKTYNPKTVGKGNAKGDPEVWIRSWKLEPW